MNQAYQKIRTHLDKLLTEKTKLQNTIKMLHKQDDDLKSAMHRIELGLLIPNQRAASQQQTSELYRKLNILKKDKHNLHDDAEMLKIHASNLRELDKNITTAQFWMKQSEHGDTAKQVEALKHIFG